MEASAPVPASSPSPSVQRLLGSGEGGGGIARERGAASFSTQANALLRKNLTYQKRNIRMNTCIVAYPILICVLLIIMQSIINNELDKPKYQCGCTCIPVNGTGTCQKVCGPQYSTLDQVSSCPIASPSEWPALMQVPRPEFRAAKDASLPSADLPDSSCRLSGSCPATVLFTGRNQTLAQSLAGSLFPVMDSTSPNFSDYLSLFSHVVPGTDTYTTDTQYIEPAFISDRPLYYIQPSCLSNSSTKATINFQGVPITIDVVCVQGLPLWCNASSMINIELFNGYRQSNVERKLNEFLTAYDFLDSSEKNFNVDIWYNSTYSNNTAYVEIGIQRVPRSLNAASNAFLKFLKGAGVTMELEYVKETPKVGTRMRFEISSLLGPLFFTWIVQLLLPVILNSLVYEKQQKLKIMMKMHGLTEGPYWLISYLYFLLLSAAYMICFVIFGSLIGLTFFRLNDYSIQVVFYFIYINLQIAFAFLVASFFSSVKTATVISYIYVFGCGLLGSFLLRFFVEDTSFPKGWIIVMELVPGFSLYRGLYEFGQYASSGSSMGTKGMKWGNLSSSENGMKDVMIIMVLEWMILLPLAFYLDQVSSLGGGIRKNPLFFLNFFKRKKKMMSRSSSLQLTTSFNRQGSAKVVIDVDNKPDVIQETELVEKLVMEENGSSYAVISDNLRKVYPGQDGNPDKLAVKGLSLALPQGECFGMLGPNGAGKTSFIHMMIGLIKPTSGTAYVHGMDIRTDMDDIYTNMGVCPQHDLLWETLTGREHLLFYGRLKNLKGATLKQAVEESLKSVNLFNGGFGDKQVRTYSGGMKRRLSVAISLIGDPKVVYMDEPSTGLDPASRNNLWNVVKRAKKDRAIILTTHSMEEAEVLCDRLGIFVDGSFQCIGNPKELRGRYGGTYVFTMTTAAEQEQEVDTLVRRLSPNANKIYHLSGTQKFELPKQEVRISEVFHAVEKAKSQFTIYAWGLADTTLEDVFIKVAKGAQAFNVLS